VGRQRHVRRQAARRPNGREPSPGGGGRPDTPENYHTVTYELAEDGGKTTLTVTQDNNATQEEADKMAEDNWRPMLQGLKEAAEK
jgi:Activator of Hsp90 ATPase homolog 1-like protein